MDPGVDAEKAGGVYCSQVPPERAGEGGPPPPVDIDHAQHCPPCHSHLPELPVGRRALPKASQLVRRRPASGPRSSNSQPAAFSIANFIPQRLLPASSELLSFHSFSFLFFFFVGRSICIGHFLHCIHIFLNERE